MNRRRDNRSRNIFIASLLSLFALLVADSFVAGSKKEAVLNQTQLADSFQSKIDFIKANGAKPEPEAKPIVVSQDEVNAYFAQRRLKMPDGVKSVVMEMSPGTVVARSHVDFAEIRKERGSTNPLLAMFDGEHDAVVTADTHRAGPGEVEVTVRSVSLDGMEVPKIALSYFIKKYVQPKYPNV